MNNGIRNILLVGVGGQGIILASEVITELAMRAGLDAKKSEVHGMSQRGGVVSSHVRFGPKVHSPLIEEGQANILCAFEILETLRWLHHIRPDGIVLANTQRIVPPIATSGQAHYPDDPAGTLQSLFPGAVLVPAAEIARELGNERLVNTIVMGRLSRELDFPAGLWQEVLAEFVPPKAKELNRQAFERGRNL
ncbi:MAG: indolepyruvate oxidoreductase subunit beta [Acidobacteria bacterium]|nr:indolepyruvate oxidoreductase subunit beta [Acidobacteriota bacterium]